MDIILAGDVWRQVPLKRRYTSIRSQDLTSYNFITCSVNTLLAIPSNIPTIYLICKNVVIIQGKAVLYSFCITF